MAEVPRKVINQITQLKALADSTTYPAEAEVARLRIQALILKYEIKSWPPPTQQARRAQTLNAADDLERRIRDLREKMADLQMSHRRYTITLSGLQSRKHVDHVVSELRYSAKVWNLTWTFDVFTVDTPRLIRGIKCTYRVKGWVQGNVRGCEAFIAQVRQLQDQRFYG